MIIINKITIGKQIENLAAIYLQNNNLQLLEKNFRSKFGEIDLILQDPIENQIVFVEVRYRKSIFFGEAVNSVTKLKQNKLIKTAHCYLNKNFHELPISYRFDIISCQGELDRIKIDWIRGAFYY